MARVRELRIARELSQEAFAELAGLKYKHYQAVEAGRKPNIQFSTVEKMAKALGMQLWELLNFDEAPLAVAEDGTEPRGRTNAPKRARRRSKN